MHAELLDQPLSTIDAELSVLFVTAEQAKTHPRKKLLERAGFKAEQDQVCALHEDGLLLCGIETVSAEALRSAAAAAIKSIKSFGYESAKVGQYGIDNVAALVEGFILGEYSYDAYKSEPKMSSLKTLRFSTENADETTLESEAVTQIFNTARTIAHATRFTRDLVNTTPDDMTPQQLGIIAQDLAESNAMACDILDENGLEEESMQSMLAVGRASVHKPRLIHVSYTPKNPKKIVSLIGKGITYDSGGLSLKPPTSMITMKMDKAGACAVLGMMKAVSELQLPVEVHGFIGAAENMVDGSAYKPDDVLKARNGKTIEVRNTDAEGRLVLADVLCYAQDKVKADYLFDYATLTGACMVALGSYTTGLMGHSDELKSTFSASAKQSGELVGVLPFNNHLKKLLKSEIADVSNIASKPFGGAITAALFLDHFITDEMKQKWLHFDIAGTAYTEAPWDCNPYGGTGAGVRMTLDFLQTISK
jgi:leucyl aminopeptidase